MKLTGIRNAEFVQLLKNIISKYDEMSIKLLNSKSRFDEKRNEEIVISY